MKVTILAPGSRGDVQPYVALGQALVSLGHTCTIVTTADHEALVRTYGLDAATIPLNVAEELKRVEVNRSVEGGGVVASFRQFAAIARRAARSLAAVGLDASRGADALVTNFSTVLVADGISRKLGTRVVQAFDVPVSPTAALPGALFPGPVLYGFSEAFLPRPAEWPPHVRITGFWFVDEPSTFAPPEELRRFCDGGPPPLCVGFGSMSTERPEQVTELVLSAARTAGVRLVLLSGWAGLEPRLLSDDVVALREVPHAWLYPRCSAIVHHGGAGTTAAAVRAGVPAVVVPFHGDQPFWASRVYRLGLGPRPIPRRKLDRERLAAALKLAATDSALRARAAAVGRAVREEQGALVAARQIVAGLSP